MFFQVNGLEISNLNKGSDSSVVTVDIVANHLTEDTDGEIVLKQAFNKDTVNKFLDIGVVEFWHESKNPLLTKEDKNKYLIGHPKSFRWEKGKPVVTAALTKSHPIVQEMLPHLEANQPVYAGSVGGKKMVLEVTGADGKKHKAIPRIDWDHLAIAPKNSVINREPGLDVRILQKAGDIMLECDDMNVFASNFLNISLKEEELKKALLAPASVGDLYNTSGGVITKQDLEKSAINLTFNEDDSLLLLDTILGIQTDSLPVNVSQLKNHFTVLGKEEFGNKFCFLLSKYFKLKGAL
jgi:hypothetical protein